MKLSKKLVTTIFGVVGVVMVNYLGMDEQTVKHIIEAMMIIVPSYLLSQGLADIGKEQKK